MITLERIATVLRPWLGDALLQRVPSMLTEIQRRIDLFRPEPGSLATLLDSLEGLISRTVERETGGSLIIALQDGTAVRMEQDDFAVIADELIWPILEHFPADARHLMLLRELSLSHPSLSALRALYTRFKEYQTSDELRALRRLACGSYPAYRLAGWLDDPVPPEKG